MRNDGTLVAAEAVKAFALPAGVQGITPAAALGGLIKDKDWHIGALIELGNFGGLEPLLQHFYRLDTVRGAYGFNRLAMSGEEALKESSKRLTAMSRSSPSDHKAIDAATIATPNGEIVVGTGAAAQFRLPTQLANHIPKTWKDAPIAVMGYGAAAMMLSFSLNRLGFHNVNVYSKVDKPFGLWDVPNVYNGTKNNPRQLIYDGHASTGPAPGPGRDIRSFLEPFNYVGVRSRLSLKKLTSKGKGLSFDLDFGDGAKDKVNYPIVINCMGIGSPVDLENTYQMQGPDERVPAVRWQNPSLTKDEAKGKMFIFIGLGNSTAEMLRVIHQYQDQGVGCDYRIFTHYPREAVHNPSHNVEDNGVNYRVFRDLSAPNLTSFQGDLPQSRQDYLRALYSNRIVAGVSSWNVKTTTKKKITAYNSYGPQVHDGEYDQLYVLTGYRHSQGDLNDYGFDNLYEGWPLLDWDGEVNNGRHAVKGLFGFGAVAQAPWAKNNIVIPGMMFRMPDLMMSIIMRAGEWHHTKT